MAAFDPLTSCSTSCRASETQVSLRMRELWRRTRAPLVVMPGRCALSRLVPWVDDAQGHASRHHSPLGLSTCLGGADAGSVRCSCGLGRHPRYATRCWPRWCMLPPGYCASLVDRRASTRRLVQERSPVRITDPRMQQVTHISRRRRSMVFVKAGRTPVARPRGPRDRSGAREHPPLGRREVHRSTCLVAVDRLQHPRVLVA